MKSKKKKKNKKNRMIISVSLIVLLILAVIGVSYAAFHYTRTGEKINQITTGTISMNYEESSNIIQITGALPTTDETGMKRLTDGEYFDFSVATNLNGEAIIHWEIAAEDFSDNTFDGSNVKFYLTKLDGNTEVPVSETLPRVYSEETEINEKTGRPANMMSLLVGSTQTKGEEVTNYRLRLYVSDEYNPQDDEVSLDFKTRINVYGKVSTDENLPMTKVYVSNTGNDITGNGSRSLPYASIQHAYNQVDNDGEIILLSDLAVTNITKMNIENKEITLRSDEGNNYSIMRDTNCTSALLRIENSNIITTTNVIFDGKEILATTALISATNSTLNLNENTIIKNGVNGGNGKTGAFGGGLYALTSTVNMNGAVITNNKLSTNLTFANGGGMYLGDSTLVLNDGEITYNNCDTNANNEHGGGIALVEGTIIMNGGTIANNTAGGFGGGIFISSEKTTGATMTVNNGTITKNTAVRWGGGGIAAYGSTTKVYIKKGTIANNTSITNKMDFVTDNGAQIFDQR